MGPGDHRRTRRPATDYPEAADFLGISRPTLVKLLKSVRIPFERPTVRRHLRVQLADVVAYQFQSGQERSDALDTMTREETEAGL